LETWDHGLNGSSKHHFHNCSLFFFLLTCFHVQKFQHLASLLPCRQ
jgi:hypothetical protein